MRSLVFVLFAAGLASSQLLFTPGKEYVYTYFGKMLSGIPELDASFAGLTISGKVIVQATESNTFKLAMREVGFSTFNDKLMVLEQPVNWRSVFTPETTPVTAAYKQIMESPVEFMIVKGEVKVVKVASMEPHWSINFKKALVAGLKIQLPVEQEVQQTIPPFFSIMEEGIEGKCENNYQISELPEYMVHEMEHQVIRPELCQGKKFFQVMKARDITKCTERSLFIASKAHKKCLLGNCNGVNTKSSVTKYFGCGETVETMELHGMINEGELQQHVLAFNTEPVVTGTQQILKLVTVQPITTVIPAIAEPLTLKDLLYVFPQYANNVIRSYEEQKQQYEMIKMDPSTQILIPGLTLDEINKEAIKTKVVEKLTLIADHLVQHEQFGKKEVPSEIKSLKTVLSIMTKDDLMALYNTVLGLNVPAETKETIRTILLETIKMSGTSPAIMCIKEMIETEQISKTEAFLAIVTMAHNIKTPTAELIDQIFELVKSPFVQNNELLKIHAHLVFATLVNKACLTTPINREFPEHIFGKMCTVDNPKITQVYIPFLVKALKETTPGSIHQSGALSVLAILGHESVLPLVVKHIEGKVEGTSQGGRKMAIYSLADIAHKNRNVLLPVYASLVLNPAEDRGVRIAAFSMMMKLQPSVLHLQKLAVSTWHEKDAEVHKFIFFSLRTLAHMKLEDHPEESYWRELTIKAQGVLPMAKPVAGIISSTFNTYLSDVLKNLHVGSQFFTSFITEKTGHNLYHRTQHFLKQVQTVPLEFSVDIRGYKSLVQDLVKTVTGHESNILENIHPEWSSIVESLEVAPQALGPFEGDFWFKFSDDIQLILGADMNIVNMIKEKVMEHMKAPGQLLEKICTKTPININKAFEFMPYQAVVPSDLGLPIVVETQMTALFSMKGFVDVDCAKPSVAVNVAQKAAYTYSGYVGTISPFTQELLVAGINQHRASNIPINAVMEVVPNKHMVKLVLKQMDQQSRNNNAIDVHHYHVKPFIAKKPIVFADMTPIVLHTNTKVIHSKADAKRFQMEFGKPIVGVDMSLKVETECDLYDKKTLVDAWANYKYNPILAGWFLFTETPLKANGMPTGRYHMYTLDHIPSMSVTKEAELTIMLNLASKVGSQQPQIMSLQGSQMLLSSMVSSSKSHQSMQESLSKLSSESAVALNALVTLKLLGGQEKEYTYSMTAGKGTNMFEHKWNLHLESEHEATPFQMMCVEGRMKMPMVPETETKYKIFNHIGFGQTCQQYFVNVDGTIQTTEAQKQHSKISHEAKQCEKLTIEAQKVKRQMTAQVLEQEKQKLEMIFTQLSLEQQEMCDKKNLQAFALDQALLEVTASENLPTYVYTVGKLVNSGLKGLLIEYISTLPVYKQTDKLQLKFDLNQKMNTISLYIQTPMDIMVYKNIRLPAMLKNTIPLVACKSCVEQALKSMVGSSILPTCVVGQGFVQSFDKKAYAYEVDQCNHVIASDCSSEFSHAILAKEVNGLKHVTVYHGKTKIELKPAQTYSQDFIMVIDGQSIPVVKAASWVYSTELNLSSYRAFYCPVGQEVVLETPKSIVRYNGKTVTVKEKTLMEDGTLCGLCGDNNNDKRADIVSPKRCVYKAPSLAALSYRVKDAQCSLTSEQQQMIQAEESKCAKFEMIRTPLAPLVNFQASYSIMKHSYIYQDGKICISQLPLVQCTQGNSPSTITIKSVKFVCLPEGRLSKLYAERIERGESPQELLHQPVAFEAKMSQPISCGPKA